jgi:hypothetical protein
MTAVTGNPPSGCFEFTAASGVPFRVRIVNRGERYGLRSITNEGPEPLVEFYDRRWDHTEHGQFVTRYYASTLLGHLGGLCLDGGVGGWSVDAASMANVREFVRRNVPAERPHAANLTSDEPALVAGYLRMPREERQRWLNVARNDQKTSGSLIDVLEFLLTA